MRRAAALVAAGVLTSGAVTACGSSAGSGSGKAINITVTANSILGGKNDQGALWITKYVIPRFVAEEKAKGKTVTVSYIGSGAADEAYESKLALQLKAGDAPDVMAIDGIWLGQFVQAGYLKPMDQVLGKDIDSWTGWSQIPPTIQANLAFNTTRYGLPLGTDGRVIYFNKQLFTRAGLPARWQPTSWADILAAAQKLKKLSGVTPIELDAGTAMGEATTTQGFLPLLAGTGNQIFQNGKWQGDTPGVRSVLGLYQQIYGSGLGDAHIQLTPTARDDSFASFAKGNTGMLLESNYFWDSVINPSGGIDPMPHPQDSVGYALIPAENPGTGLRGQNFVSLSGGTGYVPSSRTKYPAEVTDLLELMFSAPAQTAAVQAAAEGISPRNDVNATAFGGKPVDTFIARNVLPITVFRPSSPLYPQVSVAIQTATEQVVSGTSVTEAAANYQKALVQIVGASNVASS